MSRKQIHYKDYYVSWLKDRKQGPNCGKSEACATWWEEVEKGGETKRLRRRHRLGVHTVAAARPALIAFVSTRDREAARDADTVQEIYRAYVADRERDGISQASLETMRFNADALLPFFGDVRAADISADLCRAYAQERFEQGRAASTVYTELGRLRSALNWAVKNRYIDRLPPLWNCKKSDPRERVLSPDEVHQLIEAVPENSHHVRVFVWVAILTGQRMAAILELTWDRVDFTNQTVDFRKRSKVTKASEDYIRHSMSKGYQKGRAVQYMSELLMGILLSERERTKSRHVVSHAGQGIDKITNAVKRAAKAAGVEGVTPHALRHTVATWAADGGLELDGIASMLGHKDRRTTEKNYIKETGGRSKAVVDAIAGHVAPKLKVVGGTDE